MTQQTNKNWIEDISSYLHKLRANWYVHQKYNMSDENYERREKQAKTNYEDLSEKDKEKDRKIAIEIIQLLPDYESKIKELIEEMSTTKIMLKWHWLQYSNGYNDWYIKALEEFMSLLTTTKYEQTTK